MTTVLYTEANGFGAVFTRKMTACGTDLPLYINHRPEICEAQLCFMEPSRYSRSITYHPRPGSAEAIGCWSFLEDANWRKNHSG